MLLRTCSHALLYTPCSQIYCVFAFRRLLPSDTRVTNNGASLVSGMYLSKDSLLFDDISCRNPSFPMVLPLHLKQSILPRILCLFHNRNWSHPLSQADCGWFKKIWGVMCLFEERKASPAILKVPVSFKELVAVFAVIHFFMISVLIWQFSNSNTAIPVIHFDKCYQF